MFYAENRFEKSFCTLTLAPQEAPATGALFTMKSDNLSGAAQITFTIYASLTTDDIVRLHAALDEILLSATGAFHLSDISGEWTRSLQIVPKEDAGAAWLETTAVNAANEAHPHAFFFDLTRADVTRLRDTLATMQ